MVYKVERFDIVKGERCILPCMATREGAKILGGKVIEGSGVVIDASRLNLASNSLPLISSPDSDSPRLLAGLVDGDAAPAPR